MWDFSTEPEYQEQLDWASTFVRDEIEPLDLVFPHQELRTPKPALKAVLDPLKQQVRDHGLWATHLGPELGGQGHGAVKLALLNEILGRSNWAPTVFGCQAPDTGNAEILAHFGTQEQKDRFLTPVLNGEIFSSFSMTEPLGGSDPTTFRTRAWKDGDEWVLEGEKYFSSNANNAAFLITMAVTNPDVDPHGGMSMFVVPTDVPGLEFIRNIGTMNEKINEGIHSWIRYNQVRIPASALLGDEGQAFHIAQVRLGGGRIHHAMRVVARCQQAFDMMCERVLSRETHGTLIAERQLVQEAISDCWIQIKQFRLLVLHTSWKIDKYNDYRRVREDIAACKIEMQRVYRDVVFKAMHLHGAIGITNEMPLGELWMAAPRMAVVDGVTEVHQVNLARTVLKDHKPSEGLFPSQWIPPRMDAARERYAEAVAEYEAEGH